METPSTPNNPLTTGIPASMPSPVPATGMSFEVAGLKPMQQTKAPLHMQKLLSSLNKQQKNQQQTQRRIGQLLIEKGLLEEEQLQKALAESKASGIPIGQMLVIQGCISDLQLGTCLAELHGMEYVNVTKLVLQPDVVALLDETLIRKYQAIPYRLHEETQTLEVIMVHPDNLKLLDEIALITRYRVRTKLTTSMEMKELCDSFFSRRHSTDEALNLLEKDADTQRVLEQALDISGELESEFSASSAPIVQFVNALLVDAIERAASDIHIEAQQQRLLVRMRVDGILEETQSVGLKMAPAIVSRIKIVSGMDISEKRKPQDGRMRHQYGSQFVDMRVSTIPLNYGEKIVVRLLKINNSISTLDRLGLSASVLNTIQRMIHSPNGMILITGPTGSGKSTTLYASLRALNNPTVNISTIEDPIEYTLAGSNQMQVNPKAGVTFASALKALLRQDPDILMVGEIRDTETLESAIEASLTGHLVFSTLHTNSCAKTVARLIEMGAPPYLISTALVGIMAQRLARKLCRYCREPYSPTPELKQYLNMEGEGILYRAKGCPQCDGKGYRGRLMFLEVMPISRTISNLIELRTSNTELEDAAVAEGMLRLQDDARLKIIQGHTSVEEMHRVLGFHGWFEGL